MNQDTKDLAFIFINKIQYLIGELGYKLLCQQNSFNYSSETFQQMLELEYVLDYFTAPEFETFKDQDVLQLIDFFEAKYNLNSVPYIVYPKRITVIEDALNISLLDNRYLLKSGDTMTGPLIVLSTITHEDGTLINHSATLGQLNSAINSLSSVYYPLNSNPAGYLTTEIDPVFTEWLNTNPLEGLATESWVNTNFYNKTQSDNRYYPLNSNPAGYLTSFTEIDPTVPNHVKTITTTQISNWDNAFSWGDHSLAGYLVQNDLVGFATEQWVSLNFYPLNSNPANYLTEETDPIFTAWLATNPLVDFLTESDISRSNWNEAYSWGDHSVAGYQLLSQKGQVNGYASLDGSGKVPANQLPSFVDDVLEFPSLGDFPTTGETGKIYVALDTNKTYRWSGSAYIEISPSDVNSVFGRTGVVIAEANDYNAFYVRHDINNQGLNTTQQENARTNIGAGTVTSVAALTIGTTGTDITSTVASGTTTPVITLNVPTASAINRGALSSTDWNTFNNKENVLTFSTGLSRTGNTIINTITQYTDSLARQAISLTTTGNSGSSTYNNSTGVLNVPTYTLAGLGYTGAPDADNYNSWLLAASGITGTQSITSSATVTFAGTSPILVSRSSGTITYSHATSGVSAGTYNNVTVNATGHVTAGSNVSYQPLDADLTAIAALTGTNGLLRKTASDTWSLDTNTYLTAIPAATTTVLGGIRLFSDTVQTVASNTVTSTANRTYGLQVNSAGQGVVNVPWTDTTYSAGNGLTLTGTVFSLPVTISGTGTFVQSVVQTASGITVTLGTPPDTTYGLATTTVSGLVRLGVAAAAATINTATTTTDRFYHVGATTAGNMYVNVPWVAYSEITEAESDSTTSSTTRLITGRRLNSWADRREFITFVNADTRYVRFDINNQELTAAQQTNARTNIGAGTSSLILGETSTTAYRGDRGKIAYDYSQIGHLPLTGGTLASSGSTNTLNINHASGSGLALNITKGGNGEGLKVVKTSGSGLAASITGGVTLLSELNLTTKLADAHIASADTWNAKIGGTIGTGQVAFGTGTNQIGGDSGLVWDNVNKRLGIGITSPFNSIHVIQNNPSLRLEGNQSSSVSSIQLQSRGTDNINGFGQIIGGNESTGTASYLSFETRRSNQTIDEKWRITSTGILQSNGAQTIQTSTGNLILQSGGRHVQLGSASRLAIGTSNPLYNIDVTFNNTSIDQFNDGVLIRNTSAGAFGSTSALLFQAGSATGINAFIGTRYSNFATTGTGNGGELYFGTKNFTDVSPTWKWRVTQTGILESATAQTIRTSTGALTLATGGGNGNIILSPNGSGNVGIGTNAPSGASGKTFAIFGASGQARFALKNNATTDNASAGFQFALTESGDAIIEQRGNFPLRFSANSTEFMRLNPNGSFLINTISELTGGGRLQVNGIGNFSGNLMVAGNTLLGKTVDDGTARLQVVGNISATGDVIAFSTSDRNLKNNLVNIENSLDKVNKLNGYTFDWSKKQDAYTGKDYGIVAQEVEALFPEMVTTRDNGYKAVKYDRLIPVLIEAIKELSNKVSKLEGGK